MSRYDEAAEGIIQQLQALGCSSDDPPPRPDVPDSVEALTERELKTLYDAALKFYLYVGNQLAISQALKHISKAKQDEAYAKAVLTSNSDSKAKNAEGRKATAELDPKYQAACADFTQLQALSSGQERVLQTYSKLLDRIGRELYFKTKRQFHQDSSRHTPNSPWARTPTGYRPPPTVEEFADTRSAGDEVKPRAAVEGTEASPSQRKAPRSLRIGIRKRP